MPVCELLVASAGKSDTARSDRVEDPWRADAVRWIVAQLDWEQGLAELRRRYDAPATAQIGALNAVSNDSTVSQPLGDTEGSRRLPPDRAVHVVGADGAVAGNSLVSAGRDSTT